MVRSSFGSKDLLDSHNTHLQNFVSGNNYKTESIAKCCQVLFSEAWIHNLGIKTAQH